MQASKGRRATIDDLLAIPEEERYHELIDGELVRKGAPTAEHGGAQLGVGSKLFGPFNRRLGGRFTGRGLSPSRISLRRTP